METRREYRDRLVALEDALLRAGDGYRGQLAKAVEAVVTGDAESAPAVVSTDNALDGLAAYVRDEAIELVALQSPVAGELRLLSAILHIDMMVERIGELAVNLARAAHPGDPDMSEPCVRQFCEMGAHVDRLVTRSLENFARRQPDITELVALDDEIDRARHRLHGDLVHRADDGSQPVEWAMRMALAVSWLERAGDQGVSVARQVRYIVTGEALVR